MSRLNTDTKPERRCRRQRLIIGLALIAALCVATSLRNQLTRWYYLVTIQSNSEALYAPALSYFVKVNDTSCIPRLLEITVRRLESDQPIYSQHMALLALSEGRFLSTVRILSEQMREGSEAIRVLAVNALGNIAKYHPEDPEATSALRSALEDENERVRLAASRAIQRLQQASVPGPHEP